MSPTVAEMPVPVRQMLGAIIGGEKTMMVVKTQIGVWYNNDIFG